MGDVTAKLLREGIEKFVEPFDKLIEGVELDARGRSSPGGPPTIESSIPDELEPALIERVKQAQARERRQADLAARRVALGRPGRARDRQPPGLADDQREDARARAARCTRSSSRSRPTGFTDAVLLGMGGSSLAPEVIRRSYGQIPDGLRLHVLDSTDPGAVLARRARGRPRHDAVHRLVEVRRDDRDALAHALLLRARRPRRQPASWRSPTPAARWSTLADERGFRHVFENDPDIGGRYSVLSLLRAGAGRAGGRERRGDAAPRPGGRAELRAVDDGSAELGPVAGRARSASWRCRAATRRRSWSSEPIESFGLWVEQLIAESTGKQGKGILPVAGEPLGDAGRLRRRPRVRLPARPGRARRGAGRRRRGARAAPATRP